MINSNQTSTAASISNAIFNNYYPQGKAVVKNTSFSKEGVTGRTLTSRTISDVIGGDALYRSAKYPLAFYNKAIGSSMNSLITAGGESVFSNSDSLKIEDPSSTTYTEGDSGEKVATTIKGGQAYARLLSNGILGKQAMSSFTDDAINNLFSSQLAIDESIDISGYPHSPDEYSSVNGAAPSAGSRAIALDSLMSEEEKSWYMERAKILKDHNPQLIGDYSFLLSGFNFDIPNSYSSLKYSDGASNFPNVDQSLNTSIVDSSIINAGSQRAYFSPALIECLIALSKKILFLAEFSPTRPMKEGGAIHNGTSVSNHVFGRAVDIPFTGDLKGNISDMKNNAGNVDIYRKAFENLMSALNTMPQHLMPDMIVISDQLKSEYGIADSGKESETAAVYQKYPNCRYIGLSANTKHRNHIHMSFSAARAGIYTGPGGTFTINPVSVNPVDNSGGEVGSGGRPIGEMPASMSSLNVKFKNTYKAPDSPSLTPLEIYQLLTSTIAYPELASVLVAISQREGNVGSINPGAVKTGDYSIGFLQMNFLSYGKYSFVLPTSNGQKVEGWKLATKDWQSLGITDFNSWKNWVREKDRNSPEEGGKYNLWKAESKSISDDRLWIPINQVYIYYKCMTAADPSYPLSPDQKLGASPYMRHVLTPWGDYGNGPIAGPIYKTKFENALAVYVTSGKKEADLKKWIRQYFSNPNNGATSRSVPYIEGWLNGNVYNRDGSIRQ